MVRLPKEGIIAITYRCNSKCHMCNTWQYPTDPKDEIKPSDLESLPHLAFCNITGGEPFIREDIGDFIKILQKKANRIVISTNGYFTDRIIGLARAYPSIGVRVSIEGLRATNDELRGVKDCFDQGMKTLLELRRIGVKDIGFGVTLSDRNILELMELYRLADSQNLEFATACVHNSFYFHKFDNKVTRIEDFDRELKNLIGELLKSRKVKNWFRAYFNYGLLNYIHGNARLLRCYAGTDLVFMDPMGEVMACNVLEMSMGNIKRESFNKIWNSKQADEVRNAVKKCTKKCWMIGSVAPAMKKDILKPVLWVIRNKICLALHGDITQCPQLR